MDTSYLVQAERIVENMPIAFYAVDSTWHIVYANKQIELLWKMGQSELIGKDLWLLFPEYHMSIGSHELQRAMRERLHLSFETFSPLLHIYVKTDVFPKDDGGLEIFFRDYTEQKMISQLTAEHLLHLAIDATQIGFWRWDLASDRIESINHSPNNAFHFFGNTVEECIARVYPEDRAKVSDAMNAMKAKGKHCSLDYRQLPSSNDEIFWLHLKGEVFLDKDGRPAYVIGVVIDITKNKLAEQQALLQKQAEELKRKEQELLEILDGASEGSWIIDIPNKRKWTSSKWKSILGTNCRDEAEEYAAGMHAVHPEDRTRISEEFQQVLRAHETRQVSEYRIQTFDNTYIWVQARSKITYDTAGNPLRMYGTSTDITQRKKIEKELQEKNRLIIDFFTNISHEFKTPLTIILVAIDLMGNHLKFVQGEPATKLNGILKIIRQNAYRLYRLITNLLDVTKLDAGFMTVRLQTVDAVSVLDEMAESIKEYALNLGVAVTFHSDCSQLPIPVDVEKLERIVLNLISNALKHTPKGGSIRIGVERMDTFLKISVADTGIGIPEDKQDIIFDRFRQINNKLARDTEGSGIGLSLTKSLVELLHGRIWFQSKPGEGSTFFVELPILESEDLVDICEFSGMDLSKKVAMEFSDIILPKKA